MMTKIDRSDPLPLYLQTKQRVLEMIADNSLQPGERLPTESQFEDDLGVSRTTVRQALTELVNEGLITRVQGKGTFVSEPLISGGPAVRPTISSFSRTVAAQGFKPSRRVLQAELVPEAAADVLTKLEMDEGPAIHLRRVLLADDDPVGLADTWLPFDRIDNASQLLDLRMLTERSFYDILQSPPFSIRLGRARETITPTIADETEAELLKVDPAEPVLDVERVTRNASGRCIELTRIRFVGRRFVYQVDLHVQRAGSTSVSLTEH